MDPQLYQMLLMRMRQQQQQQQRPQNPMAGPLGLGQAGMNMLQGGGFGAMTNADRNLFATPQPQQPQQPKYGNPFLQNLPFVQRPGMPMPQAQPMPYQYDPNAPLPPNLLQYLGGGGGGGSLYGGLSGGGSMWPFANAFGGGGY